MEKMEPQLDEGEETAYSKASKTKKYFASFAIYYCTFALGVSFTIIGPCLVDFSNKFNTDVSQVSRVFTITLASYILASLLYGFMVKFINRQIIVIVLFVVGTVSISLYPHVTSIEAFFAVGFAFGIYTGGYDCAQVAWIIDIWRHESSPFILAQHFSYALGICIPPLILSPFLKGSEKLQEGDTSPEHSSLNTSAATGNHENGHRQEASNLVIPFSIAGCIMALGLLFQVALAYSYGLRSAVKKPETEAESKKEAQAQTKQDSSEGPKGESGKKFECPEARKIILIVLSCVFISFAAGMEVCSLQFLPTFTHFSKIALSESEGADVLSALTICYCVGRAIGIFVVLKVPPHFFLVTNFILLTIANIILGWWGGESVTMTWVGSIILGCGLSTTLPTYFAFIEKYLFISDSVSAILLVAFGSLSVIYPIIVGSSVEANPIVLIYVNLVSLLFSIVSFGLTYWLTAWKSK